jgi:holo-[acyl-carrier protein] synthase
MIKGIGIDIIEIDRIEKALTKNSRFIERIFTPKEITYFMEYQKPTASIAGYFAAKEAVSKALGTGFRGFTWQDIEIHKDEKNRPFIHLHNQAKEQLIKLGGTEVWISISHSKKNAVAQAIISKGGAYD